MSLLNILQYPDQRLKNIASQVAISDIASTKIQRIIADLFETMYQAQGIGLAAIQVNIPLQIVTIDLSEPKTTLCLINPVLVAHEEFTTFNEGCLSFPGIYTNIKRFKKISIEFFDQHAQLQKLTTDGLLSICIQHELDHLNGKTFFDHLSPLKKNLLERKLKKIRKHNL